MRSLLAPRVNPGAAVRISAMLEGAEVAHVDGKILLAHPVHRTRMGRTSETENQFSDLTTSI